MGTKLKSFILTVLIFALVSGVSAQMQPDSITVHKKITGINALKGKWYLQPVLESDTSTGRIPEIQFDIRQARFSGNTGCNRMSGSFLATDTSLHFSEKMITTRMTCIGYNESAFLQNLLRVDNYKFRKGILILTVNGVEVSRWSRKITPQKKTGKA
jgi:heat shock protein HslJ